METGLDADITPAGIHQPRHAQLLVDESLAGVHHTTGAQRRHSVESDASSTDGDRTAPKKKVFGFNQDPGESDLAYALSRKLERMHKGPKEDRVPSAVDLPAASSMVRTSVQAVRKVQKLWTGKFCKSRDYLGAVPFMIPEVGNIIPEVWGARRGSNVVVGNKVARSNMHSHMPCSLYALFNVDIDGGFDIRRSSKRQSGLDAEGRRGSRQIVSRSGSRLSTQRMSAATSERLKGSESPSDVASFGTASKGASRTGSSLPSRRQSDGSDMPLNPRRQSSEESCRSQSKGLPDAPSAAVPDGFCPDTTALEGQRSPETVRGIAANYAATPQVFSAGSYVTVTSPRGLSAGTRVCMPFTSHKSALAATLPCVGSSGCIPSFRVRRQGPELLRYSC